MAISSKLIHHILLCSSGWTGSRTVRYAYDGELLTEARLADEGAIPNRFKYTGQQLDPVTQQYYLRARFYNPVIARFTQEDTYRGDGLNLYAYCANNPVYYVDPSGHNPKCVKDAAEALLRGDLSLTREDAYRLAYVEHATKKLIDPNLSPKERAKIENRLRRMGNELKNNNTQVTKISTEPIQTQNRLNQSNNYVPLPGDANYVGPIPEGGWRLTPRGEGAHMVERVSVRATSGLEDFDLYRTPRFYPTGTPESAGKAHVRMHRATNSMNIELAGGNPGLTNSALLARYALAYSEPSLDGIYGVLRNRTGTNIIAQDVSTSEAYSALVTWMLDRHR